MRGGWAPAWRLARGLALSGNPRQRWRQVSIVFSAAVAAVALLVSAMMAAHLLVAGAHLEARQPSVGGTAVADWGKSMPVLPGGLGQIPIQWIDPDPGHADDPALVPPGLDRLPGPGEAVISPGLVRQGLTAEDLGLRPSSAGSGEGGVIGDAFLISRSEGYAIARPVEGQQLDQDFAERISGYGHGGSRLGFVETTLDVPAGAPGAVPVLALLVLPAVILLGTAARALGGVTRERAERLWGLGISASSIRRVVMLETAVLAVVGAVVGALVWGLALSWRTTWPGNDAVLLPAARGSWWMPLVVVPVTVGVAVVWATTARMVPRAQQARVRWGDWAVLPLIAAFTCLVLAIPLPEWLGRKNADLSLQMLMVGAVLVIVGLPLGLPVLARGVSGFFARSHNPTRWLAARRLGGGSARLARAGAFVGILVFIIGSEVSLYEGTDGGPAFAEGGGSAKVWTAYWADAPDGFVDTLQRRAEQEGGRVEPNRQGTDGAVVFRDCATAEEFFGTQVPVKQCGGRGTEGARDVAGLTKVLIGDPTRHPASDYVLVSGPLEWDGADALRLFQGSTEPVLQQRLGPDTDFQHPGTDWMRTGVVAASVLLFLGMLRVLGDRAIETMGEHRALERAGLMPDEAARTTVVATLLPVVIAVPLGLLAAYLFAYVGGTADYTTENYLLVTLVCLVVAGVCTAVIVGTVAWQRRLRT